MSDVDALFGKAAVLLDYITPQQLNEALQHKEEFNKVQLDISLSQILVNKNYIGSHLVEEIKDYAGKLPQTQNAKISSPGNIPQKYQKKIGRYFIISTLGKGAMGEVFEAYDPHLERIVALKVLTSLSSETNIERFQREARTMGQLTHPNIVAVYDIANEDQQYFFAMDLVEGQTLDELLQNTTIAYDEILRIFVKIVSAIEYAHSHGVIHRDLKPANILLTKDHDPKITDFGLAKVSYEDQKLSQSGMIIGTLQYMPPEQAAGKLREIDERSDIYSLGAILYEMITSFPPFSAPTFNQLVHKITKEDPILPRGIRSDVPKQLEAICLKALNKKPENRYQNAKELMWDIAAFQQGDSIQASAIHLQKVLLHKLRKHRLIALAGAFSVVIIAFLVFLASETNIAYEHLQSLRSQMEIVEKDLQTTTLLENASQSEMESRLLSLVNAKILYNQAFVIDRYNSELKNKIKNKNSQLADLAIAMEDELLLELFSENAKNAHNEKQESVKRKNKNKIQLILHELDDVAKKAIKKTDQKQKLNFCIDIYAQMISRMPPRHIYKTLFAEIGSNGRNSVLGIRSLAKLNFTENSQGFQRKLAFYQKQNNLKMVKELIWLYAYLYLEDPQNSIFLFREKQKGSAFYQETKAPYQWMPIKDKNSDAINRILMAKGRFQEAEKRLTEVGDNRHLAELYLEQGQLEKAYNLVENINIHDKESIYHPKVEILLKQRKWQTVLAQKNKIFTNEKQKQHYLVIIYAHYTTQPFHGTIKRYSKNLKYLIASGILHRKSEMLYNKEDGFQQSLDALFYANTLFPNTSEVFFQIALTVWAMGDSNTAQWYLDKALFLTPSRSDIYLQKAQVYFQMKEWTKVNFMCAQYLEQRNIDRKEQAYFLRGKSFLSLANSVKQIIYEETLDSAIDNFNEVLNINKENFKAHFFRAQAYEKKKEYNLALEDLRRTKQLVNGKKNKAKIEAYYQKVLRKSKGK